MSSLFLTIYHNLKTRKLLVGFLVLICCLGCLHVAKQITFNEDVSALLPQDQQTKQLQKVIEAASFNDKAIVMFQRKDASTKNELIAATKDFIASVKAKDSIFIKSVQAGFNADDFNKVKGLVLDNLPLFLTLEDYNNLSYAIQPDSIEKRLESLKTNLQSPLGAITERGYRKDPFKLSIQALKGFKDLQLESNLISEEGILIDASGTTTMVFLDLAISSQDGEQSAAFASFLNDRLEESTAAHPEIAVSAIGGVLYNVSNAKQIKQDILVTLGIAIGILLLVLVLFFRSIQLPLLLFLPTVCSALLALAILALFKNEVSAIALGIGSILLGITLDYALHVLTHLRNSNSIEDVFTSVTKPILLSSATTAVAFLCLLFVGSEALSTLGIFAALSVALASVNSLLLIPLFFNVKTSSRQQNSILDRLAKQDFHRYNLLVLVLIIAAVASVFLVSKVQFSTDLNQLNYETPELAKAKAQLDSITNRKQKTSLYVVSYAQSLDEALSGNTKVWKMLKQLEDSVDLSFSSIGGMVLSKDEQKHKIERWTQFWDKEKILKHRSTLNLLSTKVGFSKGVFRPWNNHLQKDFEVLDYASINLPNISLDNYISEKNGLFTVTTPVNIATKHIDVLAGHLNTLPQAVLINRTALNEGLLGRLAQTFNRLIWFSVLGVFLMMLVVFRSIWLSLLTLLPIVLSWLLTLGVMALLNLEFNVFNIIICSFIFGLGVDFAIFMTNGVIVKNKRPNILTTYRTSILLSVLTTLLGMGALIFAKHPALQSVASVSIIGVLSAVLISFTVHPFILKLYLKLRTHYNA